MFLFAVKCALKFICTWCWYLFFQRPPSQSLNYSQADDTQSSRSGDTPVPSSQPNTNSSHNAENNSESGKNNPFISSIPTFYVYFMKLTFFMSITKMIQDLHMDLNFMHLKTKWKLWKNIFFKLQASLWLFCLNFRFILWEINISSNERKSGELWAHYKSRL